MPQAYIKLAGQWTQSNNIFAKLDGEWKRVKTVWAKVNGVWVRAGGTIYMNINANVANWNMKSAITAAGYDPDAAPWQVEITIATGVTVYSTSTSIPAMQIDSLPAGGSVKLINNGLIVGCGGAGGVGTNPPTTGTQGGMGIYIRNACAIANYGTIAGGGGGGGGGGTTSRSYWYQGINGDSTCTRTGHSGGYGGNGAGINAETAGQAPGSYSPNGGGGGTRGSAGSAGQNGTVMSAGGTCTPTVRSSQGAQGGAAGKYIDGISMVTWLTSGILQGAVS